MSRNTCVWCAVIASKFKLIPEFKFAVVCYCKITNLSSSSFYILSNKFTIRVNSKGGLSAGCMPSPYSGNCCTTIGLKTYGRLTSSSSEFLTANCSSTNSSSSSGNFTIRRYFKMCTINHVGAFT